jgi:cation/acetate symporter
MTTGSAQGSTRQRASGSAAQRSRLHRIYSAYTLGLIAFVLLLAYLERTGLSKKWIGLIFLLASVILYAGIGLLTRTTDADEYYVAGRRVPAPYNGMATAADWMSAASFIGLTGTLYLSGYGGLAFVLGWTGGFCLVGLLLAPYLRRFGQYTIPDFLGARYEGHLPRALGAAAAILCSFMYLVAQIYGVGLITTRLTGVPLEFGIFLGLGGILVCSFLGGMRAVTWTQVAQYIIIAIAFVVPVVWLAIKQTGMPIPQWVYGQQLQAVSQAERRLLADEREREVQAAFAARADDYAAKLKDVPKALADERAVLEARLAELSDQNAPLQAIQQTERALRNLPKTTAEAKALWTSAQATSQARAMPLGGMLPHAQQFAGDPAGTAAQARVFEESRRNFLALVFCLMVGTAALPHILTRYYTTPSVKEARESVAWTLLFILAVYITAPALAVLVKYEVFNVLVGTRFDALPAWINTWSKVDPNLLSVIDINGDGLLQLGEIRIGSDIVVLAAPEIGGLPYVISGMVAAGGLAAALSTADGLLLTIANALSHDVYYRIIDPAASTARRVAISKVLLLTVALVAAYVASQRPDNILFLVAASFSLAASAFFPALVLGVFWKRANRIGASLGMIAGIVIAGYYMASRYPALRELFGATGPPELWWGIQPICAGVFGVPLGFGVIVVASLLTAAPGPQAQALVDRIRYPQPGER